MGYVKWLRDYCPDKIVEANKAISLIKTGSRIFIGTGSGEPQQLIRTMVQNSELDDITIYQMLSQRTSLRFRGFFTEGASVLMWPSYR